MIGEVIESRTSEFVAEARVFDAVFPYGSFVRVADGDRMVYAIVAATATTSIDDNIRAKAFFKSMEELRLEQPQIFSLLRTEIHCIILGHSQGGIYRPYYPPTHLPLHLKVEFAGEDEILEITENLSYLTKTISCKGADSEELTAAALRNAARLRDDSRAYIVGAGRELFRILDYNTQKLRSIVERVDLE